MSTRTSHKPIIQRFTHIYIYQSISDIISYIYIHRYINRIQPADLNAEGGPIWWRKSLQLLQRAFLGAAEEATGRPEPYHRSTGKSSWGCRKISATHMGILYENTYVYIYNEIYIYIHIFDHVNIYYIYNVF